MKISILAFISVLLPICSWGQNNQIISNAINDVSDVVTSDQFQSKEVAKETSKLEDFQSSNNCVQEFETHPSCVGFADSLIPKGYKENGWKTLLEIKYRPIDLREKRSLASASYTNYNFGSYYNKPGNQKKEINSSEELDLETKKIQEWYRIRTGVEPPAFDVRTQLIIDQLTDPRFTKDDAQMMDKIKSYSSTMDDQEYLRFISTLAGYVEYNDERSAYIQTEDAGLGKVTPFQQIMGTKAGICGDIHAMAAKIGEQRGWETFTVGYALVESQHVVTAMVNPKDPNSLMIVNYGKYETQSLNDGNSVMPTSSENEWEDIGTQLRVFKNSGKGDNVKMQQIGTIPTALGSFMNDLFKKENQISKAMPANENSRKESVSGSTSRQKTILNKNENKVTEKIVSEGVIIYEGEVDNAQIFGVAVSHDIYKDIYKWDEEKGQCVLKKSKYFSAGVAGNLMDLTQAHFNDTFYAYLNIKGGEIFHVYQSEHFQFKGLIGYEFEGFYADRNGFLTADGNFTTLMGVVSEYRKKGTNIKTSLIYEANLGLKDQTLMTDLGSLPSNVNPMTFNAITLDTNISQQLNLKNQLVANSKLSMSRVGGQVILSTGIIHRNTSILATYQGGVKALPIGNSLQQVNLLQNFNNTDGLRLSVSQNFSNKKGNLSGSLSGYGGITTSTTAPKSIGGVTLKLNLNGNKKKKKAP